MTDPRLGADLVGVVARLPKGAGVIFRHYELPRVERCALFDAVRRVCRRQRRLLLLAGSPREAQAWGADGFHGRVGRRLGPHQIHSAPVHNVPEIRAAEALGADCLLLSPIFATRSHPGGAALGRLRFGLLRRQTQLPVYALGGVNKIRAHSLAGFKITGWAGIDALS
ncbi:thiamine phosphate synthase [Aquisediminimonas sediminicola]|uniref:thiamine phosphate synthase n=1 Tax=Alteraquisediminimonas sediminicola TaxID=2676787 RepID=UPI001FE3125D|nr:thiamine phosphate synthase [Aquisediminimonas sediminicola]